MVRGLDRFREHFAGHEESYALIGGAACELGADRLNPMSSASFGRVPAGSLRLPVFVGENPV